MGLRLHKRLVLLLTIISLAFVLPALTGAFVSAEVREQLEDLGIEIFTVGDIPYFSTGVGLETREVTYPPFSLKLVLATKGGEYLSGVTVKIAPAGGGPILEVVTQGPWFFVDLESGIYSVEATVGGVRALVRGIEVVKGRTRTVPILW